MQAVAHSAYLSYFFFPSLLGIAGCCTLGYGLFRGRENSK